MEKTKPETKLMIPNGEATTKTGTAMNRSIALYARARTTYSPTIAVRFLLKNTDGSSLSLNSKVMECGELIGQAVEDGEVEEMAARRLYSKKLEL